jgi:hypothetical protein
MGFISPDSSVTDSEPAKQALINLEVESELISTTWNMLLASHDPIVDFWSFFTSPLQSSEL